jgi:hypothetical protein
MNANQFGFSTGALEKCDHRAALEWLVIHKVAAVELSALRLEELEHLVSDLNNVPVAKFRHVSFHAPSSFGEQQEADVLKVEHLAASALPKVEHANAT